MICVLCFITRLNFEMFLLLLVPIILLCPVIYWYYLYYVKYRDFRKLPGPTPLPVVGNWIPNDSVGMLKISIILIILILDNSIKQIKKSIFGLVYNFQNRIFFSVDCQFIANLFYAFTWLTKNCEFQFYWNDYC